MRKIERVEDDLVTRLHLAFRWAGYWEVTKKDPEGKPDVSRFAGEVRPTWNEHNERKSLYAYVSGRTVPSLKPLTRLADQLGVPRAWLAFGDAAFKELKNLTQLRDDLKAGRPYQKNPAKRAHVG